MAYKLDDIKCILNNIKNDLEVIKNIIDIKDEISIDRTLNNYFNNLFRNISALKKHSNISLDRKNQKSKVFVSILVMHLEKLFSDSKVKLSISNDDLTLLQSCISEVDYFYNYLTYYYEDDIEDKIFNNINEVYESLNSIEIDNFLKSNDETKSIMIRYIKILENYQDVYKEISSISRLHLTNDKYKRLDVDIYLNINALQNLLYEIFLEIINSNDNLFYSDNLLSSNFKEYYISLLKSHRYQELLSIQMLDKKIDDDLIRQRLIKNYISIVSYIKKIINYYKNDLNIMQDSVSKNENNKYYDLELFEDSNYQVSSNDRKSIDYIIKYDNLNKKMRNSKISRKELKVLQLLSEKMGPIKNSVSSIVKNLNISNNGPKRFAVFKKNKYTGKYIQKNNKKNKAI